MMVGKFRNEKEDIMYDLPHKELAAAIIEKAVEDYEWSLEFGPQSVIKECEHFFRSEWFEFINIMKGITGEQIIKTIRSRVLEKAPAI